MVTSWSFRAQYFEVFGVRYYDNLMIKLAIRYIFTDVLIFLTNATTLSDFNVESEQVFNQDNLL